MEPILEFITSILTLPPLRVRTMSSPPFGLNAVLTLMFLVLQVFLYMDIDELIARVTAYYKAEWEKKYLALLAKIRDDHSMQTSMQTIDNGIKISKSKSKLILNHAIHNLSLDERIAYILSVTPSQYMRDREKHLSDIIFNRTLDESLTLWTNPKISTKDSLTDDDDNNFESAEEE